MSNINDTFFDGHYKEIWRSLIPDELTVKEVDFMLPYFNLQPGSQVLDLMCGYGRHAIALAKKGMNVTAVDNLGDYINEINEVAEKEIRILKLIADDKTTDEISKEVFLSPRTIETIRQNMKQKVEAKTIAGLVMYAMRNKLLE